MDFFKGEHHSEMVFFDINLVIQKVIIIIRNPMPIILIHLLPFYAESPKVGY